MEITVLDKGDLPVNTILSVRCGAIRRQMRVDVNKMIALPASTSGGAMEPVKVDLLSQLGSQIVDFKPEEGIYDVPIKTDSGDDCHLQLSIRHIGDLDRRRPRTAPEPATNSQATCSNTPANEKFTTAISMRSYLDQHKLVSEMQGLLQEVLKERPDDPTEFLLKRLEAQSQKGTGSDDSSPLPATETVKEAVEEKKEEAEKEAEGKDEAEAAEEEGDAEDEDEDNDDDVVEDMPPPPAHLLNKGPRMSVSAEAYGAHNVRKDFVPKVFPKSEDQKDRIKGILQKSWMFQNLDTGGINIVLNAMIEKKADAGIRLINQGDDGDVMWIIEEGVLECYKKDKGASEEKLVKTCVTGDVFGELALLYNQPRQASVQVKESCVLWQLDRETFNAICKEQADKNQPGYAEAGKPAEASKEEAKPAEAPKEDEHADDHHDDDHHSDDDHGDDDEGEAGPARVSLCGFGGRKRREGVSAEAVSGAANDNWTPPSYPKSPEERKGLSDMINNSADGKLHMLFGSVQPPVFEKILDAMEKKPIPKGQSVMHQGDVGDFFYIVKEGDFDIFVKKKGEDTKKVFEAGKGFAFGELALLYNAPRTATITATIDSEVWCLDRTSFRMLVVKSAEDQFKAYCAFLDNCDIFHTLSVGERASLAEVMEEETFDDDEAILEQGEKDDKMFIVQSGRAVACISGPAGEVEVMQYHEGDYFGEIALINQCERKASVYAVGSCSCLYISRQTFNRVLGPIKDILARNMDKYAKYEDAMVSAHEHEEHADEEHADEHGGASVSMGQASVGEAMGEDDHAGGDPKTRMSVWQGEKRKSCVIHKGKRDRNKILLEGAEDKGPTTKKEDTPVEGTLADKVAQDFLKPILVKPTKAFNLPTDTKLMCFGGLINKQKHPQDKPVIVRPSAGLQTSADGDDKTYSWYSPIKLKNSISVATLSQKGQKSAFDPTPNQDNFFITQAQDSIGTIHMYGVFDGHGPFGHLVSFRLVQSMPHFLTTSENFKARRFEEALTEAFLASQKDLEDFCGEQDINIEASGAAGSVMIFEEQTVHVAYIGDARVFLGSWNKRDTVGCIYCSKDHKPELPEEKKRLEDAGSEVREVSPGSWRIYQQGTGYPGLTMSRAFGDTACDGVLREPEYHKYVMQPTDEWYAIVASDGVWEFLDEDAVVKLTSKKLRLKGPRETVKFLVEAARKRWNHFEGDYCDDITAILVQFNQHSENATSNMSVTLNEINNDYAQTGS